LLPYIWRLLSLSDTGDGMGMGLDGLVGVRGEGGTDKSICGADAVDMRFDSLAPAFSSSLWAMDSQLEERSVLTVHCEVVVATERVERGRDPNGGIRVYGAARADGGRETWLPSSFAGPLGESAHKVNSLLSDPALDGL